MKALRSEEVFQAAGLLAWAVVGVTMCAAIARRLDRELLPKAPPQLSATALGVMTAVFWTLVVSLLVVFAVSFCVNTRRVQPSPPSRLSLVLLVVQVVLALAMTSDLLFIVAAEIPFVLAGRSAVAWISGQLLVSLGAGVAAVASGDWEPVAGVAGYPVAVAATLTIASALSWQLLAFCAGHIAATESRGRRELARVHADLVATQEVLAQSARVAERAQIARELHDSIGHHLAALSLNLELASRVAEGRAAGPVADARGVAKLLLAEVREVVGAFKRGREVELRLALQTLVAGVSQPRVHLDLPDGPLSLEPAQAHTVFRAAQEAITNAVRHARAENLWIVLQTTAGKLTMVARDDGRGAPAVPAGHGLEGMRERFEELGGGLAVETHPGAGFVLRASLPLGKDADA